MSRRIALTVFLGVCLLCIAQIFFCYLLLPERVASHFGISGKPDGWSSKTSFIMAQSIITGIVAVLFPVIAFGLSKIPVSLINLPNKDYWLSPERKQASCAFFEGYFLWFGTATLLLLLDIFSKILLVGTGAAEGLGHPLQSLAAYIVFVVIWIAGLYLKFGKRTPKADERLEAKRG